MTATTTATTRTVDGRTLAFCEWGDPSGATVVTLDSGHFTIYDRMSELLSWLTEAS